MNILFMCVANSARSQLAEGLAREIFPKARVMSSGSAPATLNPWAVRTMREIGIDITAQFSKSVDQLPPDFVARLDYVITLCAEEVCPTIFAPNAKRLHWPLPDPATKEQIAESEAMKRFREARDSIEKRLRDFKEEIGA